MTVLLVIFVLTAAGPQRMVNERKPDIATCLAEGQQALEAAAVHDGDFEFVVQCSVVKEKADPA
jgi:hypothetical protein